VYVDDGETLAAPDGMLNVGHNLHDMLLELRQRTTSRRLWIDAICVDQQNSIEKGEQVKRMGAIFQFVSRVILWLGEDSRGSCSGTPHAESHGPTGRVHGRWCLSPGSRLHGGILVAL
jgi:hypothetical protein